MMAFLADVSNNPSVRVGASHNLALKRILWILAFLYWSSVFPDALLAASFHINVGSGGHSGALDKAVLAARQHRKINPDDTIIIDLPARLDLTSAIQLSRADSGAPGAPLIFEGAAGAGTIISGQAELHLEAHPGDADPTVAKMPASVRSRVERYTLGSIGTAVLPAFAPHSSFSTRFPGKLMVFQGGRRLTPARWPDKGYATNPIPQPGAADAFAIRIPKGIDGLTQEKDVWIAAFWAWSWWFEAQKIDDIRDGALVLKKPDSALKAGARFYLYNIASGLTDIGQYYWNADAGSLYLIPGDTEKVGRPGIAAVESILKIKDASNIQFDNVAFEKSIGAAVTEDNSDHIVLRNCYAGHTGTWGIVINGGHDNLVDRCVVDDTGYAGVAISGGDQKTLSPSGHIVRNSRISRFGVLLPTYQPGVALAGVGASVEGCEILNAPHAGILFGGNDHKITGNILHSLVLDSNDSGAIYSGRNWLSRGTIIKSNFIFDITNHVDPSLVEGVYLDDQLSGITIEANIFRGVDEPILVGGGRDNLVEANLFLVSKGHPIVLDSRGLNWQADMTKPGGTLRKGLDSAPYREPPYADRYPGLKSILEESPGAPLHNSFLDNIADVSPVVSYDAEAISKMGTDQGNRMVSGMTGNVSQALSKLDGMPALAQLRETEAMIAQTRAIMQSLPFRAKATP